MQNMIAAVLFLLLVSLFPCNVSAQTATNLNFSSTQNNNYEILNALPQKEVPLVITASFELRDINYIDEEVETFDFTGILKLSWHDPRQVFDPAEEGINEKLYMGDYQFNEVYNGWWPQVVLANESGVFEKHGVLLRILPDGSLTLIETVNATAKTVLNLRRYPFDTQYLEVVFEVLGFGNNEVILQTSSDMEFKNLNPDHVTRVPQWHLSEIRATTADRKISASGRETATSKFVVSMELQRKPLFILRLVILPMIIIVILSWSVFWMDKTSLGDRISTSFIGILTVVAYQMVIGDILPNIAYVTLVNAFMNLSFFIICSTVIINFRVSFLDRQGKSAEGDQLDRRCRWMFPLTYVGLILVCVIWSHFLPPP